MAFFRLFGPPDVEKLKTKRNVKGLIKALGYEKDWGKTGDNAVEALTKIGSVSAEPLVATLRNKKDSNVRWRAAYALGEIGDARAVEPLIATLKDKDEDVRGWVVINALGKIGNERSVKPLLECLLDNLVSDYAIKAIQQVLERIAAKVSVEDLGAIASLGYVEYFLGNRPSCQGPDRISVDCSIVKQLARINLNAFRPIGRGKTCGEQAADPEAVRAAVQRAWARCYPDRPAPPAPPRTDACVNCGVGSFLNVLPNGDVFPCHVLTDRAFRCGNVREEGLPDICDRAGLLGRLQALDFRDLARQDERLLPLAQPHTCMGNVYARTKTLPVWSSHLPMLNTD